MTHPDDLTPVQVKEQIIQAINSGHLFPGALGIEESPVSVHVSMPGGQRLVVMVIDSVSRWNSMDEWKENTDGE